MMAEHWVEDPDGICHRFSCWDYLYWTGTRTVVVAPCGKQWRVEALSTTSTRVKCLQCGESSERHIEVRART